MSTPRVQTKQHCYARSPCGSCPRIMPAIRRVRWSSFLSAGCPRTCLSISLCVSPNGVAHLVPLSFAWDGEHLIIATEATALTTRNLTGARRARLALGQTRDVVMIDAVGGGTYSACPQRR
jgi:hypothetical protein